MKLEKLVRIFKRETFKLKKKDKPVMNSIGRGHSM